MNHPADYFAIPTEYGDWLGLRWAPDGREALEYITITPTDDITFAMNDEVSRFLTGLHAIRPPMEFAYVLHLMQMVGVRVREPFGLTARSHVERRLSDAFRAAGRPLRNAGSLCGALSRDVPRLPDVYPIYDLSEFPRRPWLPADRIVSWPHGMPTPAPSLEPMEFQARILAALAALDDHALAHWMKHGRGPIAKAGEKVAEEVAANRLSSLPDALDEVTTRPRLTSARPLVVRLDAALAIPPRRRSSSALPVGGYADVTTRGNLEAILPSQLALDNLEFLRRFAARELLYYHREEPRSSEGEELVVVVDQGIRTWGDPRLVLAAAAIALAKRAGKRGMSLTIATTGGALFQHDATAEDAIDGDALGCLLEASDFTRNPALALDKILAAESRQPARDVVLLSHPRSVLEIHSAIAARKRDNHTRVFAATVDDSGEVALAELREGGTVPISRCRVTISPAVPPPAPVKTIANQSGDWTGDVEPIPFPFPLGVVHPLVDGHIAFDHAGEKLLVVAGPLGMLHVWDLTTGETEILPRPFLWGWVISSVWGVIGVRGGFVVAALSENGTLIAAHYDFGSRACAAHDLGPPPGPRGRGHLLALDLRYDPTLHAVVFRNGNHPHRASAIDLGATKERACFRAHSPESIESKVALRASLRAGSLRTSKPHIVLDDETVDPGIDTILFDESTGRVRAQLGGTWAEFQPLRDGHPTLKGRTLVDARYAGGTLALRVEDEAHLFAIPSGASLGAYPSLEGVGPFELSADGRRIVRQVDRFRVEVHDVGSPFARIQTQKGRVHDRLGCFLGDRLIALGAGKQNHEIHWRQESLGVTSFSGDVDYRPSTGDPAMFMGDHRRYLAMYQRNGLTTLVDVLGQVAILDDDHRLVVMFHAFRGRFSAWMPDGTTISPRASGSPPFPLSSLRRIAEALRTAERRPQGTAP